MTAQERIFVLYRLRSFLNRLDFRLFEQRFANEEICEVAPITVSAAARSNERDSSSGNTHTDKMAIVPFVLSEE